jgi:hypothetical protein
LATVAGAAGTLPFGSIPFRTNQKTKKIRTKKERGYRRPDIAVGRPEPIGLGAEFPQSGGGGRDWK